MFLCVSGAHQAQIKDRIRRINIYTYIKTFGGVKVPLCDALLTVKTQQTQPNLLYKPIFSAVYDVLQQYLSKLKLLFKRKQNVCLPHR